MPRIFSFYVKIQIERKLAILYECHVVYLIIPDEISRATGLDLIASSVWVLFFQELDESWMYQLF